MVSEVPKRPTYAEFFSGGGMVRAALTDVWQCQLANDIDPMKCEVYGEGPWPCRDPKRDVFNLGQSDH